MTTMTLPDIKCQAKDKTTCKYHGALIRSEKALTAGDWTAWAKAQTDIAKALKHTPEVLAFFAEAKKATAQPAAATPVQPRSDEEIRTSYLRSLADASYDEKLDYLASVVNEHFVKGGFTYGHRRIEEEYVDRALGLVVEHTPQDTMYDITERMTNYRQKTDYTGGNWQATAALRQVVALWQDRDALVSRDMRERLPENPTLRDKLNRELAIQLAKHGELKLDGASSWGWEDDRFRNLNNVDLKPMSEVSPPTKFTVLSVLDAHEDEWTVSEDSDHSSGHTGIDGIVLIDDGTVRKMRFETSVPEIMQKVQWDTQLYPNRG
jgi:hypothetical protein